MRAAKNNPNINIVAVNNPLIPVNYMEVNSIDYRRDSEVAKPKINFLSVCVSSTCINTSMTLSTDVPQRLFCTTLSPTASLSMERRSRFSEKWTQPTSSGVMPVLTTLLNLLVFSLLPKRHPLTLLEEPRRSSSPPQVETLQCLLW